MSERLVDKVTERRQLLSEQIEQLATVAHADLDGKRPDLPDAECMLSALIEDMTELHQLKFQQGAFDEILEQLPHWAHKIQRLKEDDELLVEDLNHHYKALSDHGHLRRLQRHLRGWLVRFKDINHRETRLLQDACNVEIGAQD